MELEEEKEFIQVLGEINKNVGLIAQIMLLQFFIAIVVIAYIVLF